MSTAPVLAALDVAYDYPGHVPALAGLTLRIARGVKLAVLGANGSGKTTLFLHLNGTLRPRAGRIECGGVPVGYGRAALLAWRARVGLVLQEPDDQLFAATVAEDVAFGPRNLGLPESEIQARVEAALTALGMAGLADRPTHMLSHGQKRRAVLAGVVAMRPEVILLDEPTAGLDPRGAEQLLDCLDALNQAGTTLVFSSHDFELARDWADRVVVIGSGRCLAEGDPAAVLGDPAVLDAAGLSTRRTLRMNGPPNNGRTPA